MNIVIFPHSEKTHSKHLAVGIQEYLSSRGARVYAEDATAKAIGARPLSEIEPKNIDFILSMGGDGTILGLVHTYAHLEAPILGINLGHLGFMADVPVTEIYPSLQDLIQGAYSIDERLSIDALLPSKESFFAVNEVVIHRGQNSSLIELAIHLEGTYLNTFVADGIIISTPNGSTAYSLAAGGPILTPNLDAVVITPISPHTISNRPIVLNLDREIQIQYLSDLKPVEVSGDGLIRQTLQSGDVLKITRSKKIFRLVNLERHDYYATLRSKLNWSGKLR